MSAPGACDWKALVGIGRGHCECGLPVIQWLLLTSIAFLLPACLLTALNLVVEGKYCSLGPSQAPAIETDSKWGGRDSDLNSGRLLWQQSGEQI